MLFYLTIHKQVRIIKLSIYGKISRFYGGAQMNIWVKSHKNHTMTQLSLKRIKNTLITQKLFICTLSIATLLLFVHLIQECTKLSFIFVSTVETSSVETLYTEEMISNLIAMQANTLTIVAIIITIVPIGFGSVLYYYIKKIRKFEKDSEKMQLHLKNLFSLSLIQSLSSQKYYAAADILAANDLDVIKRQDPDNETTYFYARIHMLLAVEKEADIQMQQGKNDATDLWENVVDLCEEILHLPDIFSSVEYIVRLKVIFANYTLCRLTRNESRKDSSVYIIRAQKHLKQIDQNQLDSYGQVNNLRGLVLLWELKTAYDTCSLNFKKCSAQFDKVEYFFETAEKSAKAMNFNADVTSFISHQGITKMNRMVIDRKLTDEQQLILLEEADALFKKIPKGKGYGKAPLNQAHIILLKLRVEQNCLHTFRDLTCVKITKENEANLKEAEKLLNSAKEVGETIVDIDYRLFEIKVLQSIYYRNDSTKSTQLKNELKQLLIDNGFEINHNTKQLFAHLKKEQKYTLGFLTPWLEYAYWNYKTDTENQNKWKESAIRLNERISNERYVLATELNFKDSSEEL